MVKTLENNVKGSGFVRRIKAGALALVAVAAIGLAGCKPYVSPEPDKPEPDYGLTLSEVNVNEGENKSIDLSKLTSESGITWTGLGAYDSKLVTPTLTGNNLTVQVSDDITETVPYSIGFNTNKGSTVLKGVINNVFEISGTVQDNETHTNQAGTVKLFNSSNSSVAEASTSDGNFYLRPGTLSSGSKVKLQAKTNNSYARTLEFNCDTSKDISNALLRVVPYVNFDINDSGAVNEQDSQDFIDFLKQINTGSYPDSEGLYRIKKWNLENLTKIEICKRNSDKGISFSQTAINNAISYIPEIKKFVAGKKDLGSIITVLDESSSSHQGVAGYITVIPDNMEGTMGGTGLEEAYYQNPTNSREITSSSIHLIPTEKLLVIPHEFGHSFIAPVLTHEEAEVISSKYTIMYYSSSLSNPGLADEKAGKVLYEESYSAGEKIENILRMKFADGSS